VNGMVSRPRHGLSLCAGGGGLDLGVMLAEPGFHTRAFVEWEDWPRAVLIAAQAARATLRPPRSGTTFAASMPGPSAGRLMPSSPDILASRSAQQANAVAPTIPAISGPKSRASSTNAAPNGCSSKTCPATPCVREVVRCFTFALFLRWAG